ncbi:DUF3498 domain-containing protein [Ceratocystis lukuohia]|uniref:DUF3498 domain-containing protein n=1 Tax=Ceratocystis lukuohia TaxID=2019550 RepID=A0ABR4MNQ5_9PEZI
MGLTGDNRPLNITPTRRGLGWWSKNESDITGLPAQSQTSPELQDPLSPTSPTQLSPLSLITIPSITHASSKNRLRSAGPLCASTDEELFNLSIADSLGREPTTLASTRQLHRTAWSLLSRFQAAYREQSLVVAQMKTDIEAAIAEGQQHSQRAVDLKRKVDIMSKKALEQEDSMQELLLALSAETKARVEEHEQNLVSKAPSTSGGNSVPLVVSASTDVTSDKRDKSRTSVPSIAGSIISEDLGVEAYQTDDESTAEEASIFSSRSRSPTLRSSVSISEDVHSRPTHVSRHSSFSSSNTLAAQRTPQNAYQSSQSKVAQKIWRGFGGGERPTIPEVVSSCSNCEGQPASIAWDTVSLLRDENRDLKSRVTNLETGIDAALDAVNGVATLEVSMNPQQRGSPTDI